MRKMIMKRVISAGLIMLITSAIPITAYAGWQYTGNQWKYENGGSYLTGWQNINASWYYFNQNGTMMTGWQQIGGAWYYLKADGSMAFEQWVGIYYVGSNGAMVTNSWIGPYYVGNDGAWVMNASNTENTSASETVWLTDLEYFDKDNLTYRKDYDAVNNVGDYMRHCLRAGTMGYGGKGRGWIEYYLNGNYSTLSGMLAVTQDWRDTDYLGYVVIYVDDNAIYESPTITSGDFPVEFEVDISGCQILKIYHEGGDPFRLGNLKLTK